MVYLNNCEETYKITWLTLIYRLSLWILNSFVKKNREKNKQWFWDQNRNLNYSIVLKQSIGKPAFNIPILFISRPIFTACTTVVIVLLLLDRSEYVGGNRHARDLYKDLMQNYSNLVRPVMNSSESLTVKLGLKLTQLIAVVICPKSEN